MDRTLPQPVQKGTEGELQVSCLVTSSSCFPRQLPWRVKQIPFEMPLAPLGKSAVDIIGDFTRLSKN